VLDEEMIGDELGEGEGAHLSNLALVPQPILQLKNKLE